MRCLPLVLDSLRDTANRRLKEKCNIGTGGMNIKKVRSVLQFNPSLNRLPLELQLSRPNIDRGIIIADGPKLNVLGLLGVSKSRFRSFVKTPSDMVDIVKIRRISKVTYPIEFSKWLEVVGTR